MRNRRRINRAEAQRRADDQGLSGTAASDFITDAINIGILDSSFSSSSDSGSSHDSGSYNSGYDSSSSSSYDSGSSSSSDSGSGF